MRLQIETDKGRAIIAVEGGQHGLGISVMTWQGEPVVHMQVTRSEALALASTIKDLAPKEERPIDGVQAALPIPEGKRNGKKTNA